MNKQAHIFLSGMVQGVGCRHFVSRAAHKFKINGWTRNTEDERVEIMAEGEEKDIEGFIKFLKENAPEPIMIEKVDTEFREATERFDGFRVLPSAV